MEICRCDKSKWNILFRETIFEGCEKVVVVTAGENMFDSFFCNIASRTKVTRI
jgi:hypothetical protein